MSFRFPLLASLSLAAVAVLRLGGADLPADGAATRDAFLHLIDRPRVPPSPSTEPAEHDRGLLRIAFSYASDAASRVPGLLVKADAPAAGRRPVVIALHGTGGKKEGELPLLEDLARAGFVAVAIDAPWHGARAPDGKSSYADAILRTFRTGRGHPFFYDTVWDVMRLIDYLATRDDVDAARIGLFGVSKGGIETYLTAAVDPRVAVAVPCIGVESFRWAIEHDSWQSRIGTIQTAFDRAAQDEGVAQPGAAFVRTFYARVAPGLDGRFDGPAMVPLIAPRPLLSINGDSDPRTPAAGLAECVEAARQAYAARDATPQFVLYLEPHTAHRVTPEATQAAEAWFIRWLKP